MRTDLELKRLLAAELCAMWEGWDQYLCASMLRLHQPQVSALRRGQTAGFSSDRLLRLIALSGYSVEVILREMERRIPRVDPTITVQRYNRHGMPIERPAPGPVRRVLRWSGEVDVRKIERAARGVGGLSDEMDNRFGIDDE